MSRRRYYGLFFRILRQDFCLVLAILLVPLLKTPLVHAQTYKYKVLYQFPGMEVPYTHGRIPQSKVTLDPTEETLYGTTDEGGLYSSCGDEALGCGVVYALDIKTRKQTVLHRFGGVPNGDGYHGNAAPIVDDAGNLYGTTYQGGVVDKAMNCGAGGCGIVYKVNTKTLQETVLYRFTGLADGMWPTGTGLLRDPDGTLYGTATGGGTYGGGTVWKLETTGQLTVLYSFRGDPDGFYPEAPVSRGVDGNFYGVTSGGGTGKHPNCDGNNYPGCGTVFELDKNGTETVLASFTGPGKKGTGALPKGCNVVRDASGNLYGTTLRGGSGDNSEDHLGWGVVWKVDTSGKLIVLHDFTNGSDGGWPWNDGGLILDKAGYLYGTAASGSDNGSYDSKLWKIDTSGKNFAVLYTCPPSTTGLECGIGLVMDSKGNFYSANTGGGGQLNGNVIEFERQ